MVTYDEAKRHEAKQGSNIRAHGFDVVGCEAVFSGFTITREDGRDAYGE